MIIDFHTHIFPDKLAHSAISSLEKSSGNKAFSDGTKSGLLREMDKAGVQKAVLMPIAVKPSNTPTINNIAIENNRGRFVSFGSVHPYFEDWENELHRLSDAGIRGIKLHPDFQNVFLDDEKTVDLMSLAGKLNLLITIHGGMDVSFPDIHKSTPKRLVSVLPELKHCKIICAHSGGCGYEDDVINLLLDKEQIYIDTSYSLGKTDKDKLLTIYNGIDKRHILFGTDSPWGGIKEEIEMLNALPLAEELKDNIFSGNALKLLGV